MKIERSSIYLSIAVILIAISIYFSFFNQTVTVISLGLLFTLTFFKREFYDFLKSTGI